MIAAYVDFGQPDMALKTYDTMIAHVTPNEFTYVCVLTACADRADLAKGKQIHDHLTQSNIELNIPLQNALINMYLAR